MRLDSYRPRSLLLLLAGWLLAFGAAAEGVDVQRSRFLVVPEAMTSQISAQQYAQMKREAQSKGALNVKPEQVRRVQQIAARIVPQGERFNPGSSRWAWEANVINAPTVNAFAMPGGKVMVYAGLMERLQLTDDELAAVIGHEIAHAVLEHGRARMQTQLLQNLGVTAASIYLGLGDLGTAALAQAADVALALPYSRGQEVDADLAGLEMAARAGYDPRAAVSVWRKMSAAGGGQPPAWLSTHPDHQRRIQEIEAALPKVMPLYEAARATARAGG
jgi:predicted Zn-dependent protease